MPEVRSTILLTGFEPFGVWQTNPSWEVARSLEGFQAGPYTVASRQIPVHWTGTWPALERAVAETQPSCIIMLGLAGKRTRISVESRALNKCSPTPDNAGSLPGCERVDEAGPDELGSTFPTDAIVRSIEALGLPVERSEDAGGYLCNHSLYRLLQWAATLSEPVPAGFIHIPNTKEVNLDSPLSLHDMKRAITAAVEAVAEQLAPAHAR